MDRSVSPQWMAAVLLGAVLGYSAQANDNSVALFLEGAERQCETSEQLHEIRQALIDMLELSSEQLREKRYATYRMEPDAWTAPELLERYFVPQAGAFLDRESFYRDVKAPAAQAAIRKQLAAIERAMGDEPSVQPS
jgi:hypothetical protein